MVSFIYPIRKECISLYVFYPAGFGKCRRSDGMDVFWFMGLDILTCGNLLDELFGDLLKCFWEVWRFPWYG